MINKQKPDTHLFTTTHPYFIELGLGSFTISSLIEWWNQKTANGRYLNRRHINKVATPLDTLATPTNKLNSLLGININTEFFWYGWKPNLLIENAGRFKKQNLFGMLGNTGGLDADKWEYKGVTAHNMNDINSIITDLEMHTKNPMITTKMNEFGFLQPIYASPPTAEDVLVFNAYYAPLLDLNPIYSLIQLNKYMNHVDDFYPRETWDRNEENTVPGLTNQQVFGAWALINEIRAAKSNPAIEWSADITFYVSENNGLLDQCEITDNVKFTLYLTDEAMISSDNKAIAVRNMTFIGPKRDALGAAGTVDGERGGPDADRPVAGEIDLQWNPVSKKWQSGNVNMLAKLVTNVAPGRAPSLEHLLSNNIQATLEDANNTFSYIPARGSGMPIRTQNSMPLQWSPNYAQTQDVRCDTESVDKLIIPLYNFNPRRFYVSGEEVLITLIDNIWHISDLGESNLDQIALVPTGIGKWGSFSYLTTSSQFFFRGINSITASSIKITPRSAELNFHKLYYNNEFLSQEDQELNGATFYGPSGNETLNIKPIGGYNFSQPFDTSNHEIWYDQPGWLQTTSFDFLDAQIYGLRTTCSISSTSATLNSAGNNIPFDNSNYAFRNSAHTGTFFGCVFPEGYQGTDIYDAADRANQWFVNSHGQYANRTDYFKIDPAQVSKNPFQNDQNRSSSNAKSRATANDPVAPILNLDPDNIWYRGNQNQVTKKDANMFYLNAEARRKTIPADVMLNASPNGRYGSPIKPLSFFTDIYNPLRGAIDHLEQGFFAKALEAGVWLYKEKGEGTNILESAFDFEPVRKDNLMFRPLKLEGYLQFNDLQGLQNEASELDIDRYRYYFLGYYAEPNRTQINQENPVAPSVWNREEYNCFQNIVGRERGQILPILKWGAWTSGKPLYSRLHRFSYWDSNIASNRGMLSWTNIGGITDNYQVDPLADWNGAGAFGVITTNIKVQANSVIQFTTSNLYGMSPAAHGRFTLTGGHEFQDKTWGVSNFIDSYKQENIIDLSVRIFQGHPDHLTLYDPRYFAVHHFNEGVAFLNEKYYGTGVYNVNSLGQGKSIKRNYRREEFKNIRNSEGSLLNQVFYDYPEASGVDVKIPSRYAKHLDFTYSEDCHIEGGFFQPVTIDESTLIYSDGTFEIFNNPEMDISPPIMPDIYWNVNTKRTGKLLPYMYKIPTLSIPTLNGAIVTVNEEDVRGESVITNGLFLIIKNRGQGYTQGDGVGILDYSIILEVLATGDNGSIEILHVVDPGSGIPLDFVRATGDKIGEFEPIFNIRTLTGSGDGFEAYFVSSQLRNMLTCDPKPFLIKRAGNEINRIAANEPSPSHSTFGFTAGAEQSAYIQKTESTDFSIPTILKSKDGSYDVFFHFHNDISMTWLACSNLSRREPGGDFNNASECTEQHVTLETIKLV